MIDIAAIARLARDTSAAPLTRRAAEDVIRALDLLMVRRELDAGARTHLAESPEGGYSHLLGAGPAVPK